MFQLLKRLLFLWPETSYAMDDKDYDLLMDLAIKLRNEEHNREEALDTFMKLGILDANGDFTESYKILGEYIK